MTLNTTLTQYQRPARGLSLNLINVRSFFMFACEHILLDSVFVKDLSLWITFGEIVNQIWSKHTQTVLMKQISWAFNWQFFVFNVI